MAQKSLSCRDPLRWRVGRFPRLKLYETQRDLVPRGTASPWGFADANAWFELLA